MHDTTPPLGTPPPVIGSRGTTEKKKTGWSTWSPFGKFMAVVGIAIGSLMLIAFLGALATGVWLYLPGSQVESALAVSGDSKLVARLHVDVDDPGVSAVMALAARTVEDAQRAEDRANLPENLRFLAGLQGRQTKDALEMFWPREATLAMQLDDQGEAEYAAVINMRRFGGMVQAGFKMFAVSSDVPPTEYRGHTVIEGDGVVATHDGSSVVVASRVEDLRKIVDRIVDGEGGAGARAAAPELRALSERLQKGHDAHVVLDGQPPFLDAVGPGLVVRSGVAADLVDDDRATGQAVLVAAPGQEEAAESALRAEVERTIAEWRAQGVAPVATVTREGAELRVAWHVTGLREWMVRSLGEALSEPEPSEEVDAVDSEELQRMLEQLQAEGAVDDPGAPAADAPANEGGDDAVLDETADEGADEGVGEE